MYFLSMDFKECAWYVQAPKDIDESQVAMYEADGYKRRENVNPNTKETVVSYRRYYKSVSGYLTGLKIDSTKFGNVLKIYIEDEDETNLLNLNMFNQNGSLSGYVADFIRHIGNIPLDEKIEIGINKKLKNDKDRPVQILTILYEERTNTKGKELMMRALSKDDIPAVREYEIAGNKKYDTSERDTFLCNILEAFIKEVSEKRMRVAYNSPNESNVAPAQSSNKPAQELPKPVSTPNSTQVTPNTGFYNPEAYGLSPVDDLPF